MSSDYTPTPDEVRKAYVEHGKRDYWSERWEEFDRMLQRERLNAQADVLNEVATDMPHDALNIKGEAWLRDMAAALRNRAAGRHAMQLGPGRIYASDRR